MLRVFQALEIKLETNCFVPGFCIVFAPFPTLIDLDSFAESASCLGWMQFNLSFSSIRFPSLKVNNENNVNKNVSRMCQLVHFLGERLVLFLDHQKAVFYVFGFENSGKIVKYLNTVF